VGVGIKAVIPVKEDEKAYRRQRRERIY